MCLSFVCGHFICWFERKQLLPATISITHGSIGIGSFPFVLFEPQTIHPPSLCHCTVPDGPRRTKRRSIPTVIYSPSEGSDGAEATAAKRPSEMRCERPSVPAIDHTGQTMVEQDCNEFLRLVQATESALTSPGMGQHKTPDSGGVLATNVQMSGQNGAK